ncbi:hypothetical protein P5G51_006310 [Virgibacillus sp. 179-BFC.A HS]|uniref:Uncharacterized protein n=1 Tax=Tigheibacillus jepli TaxID=3035914 RepID=A0ABU5CFF6_9BACI|nr:hypothetical protein [Virgibacillus sp. 179-BFC.A HS]MDY0405062.1 hypothetical protein [Virgibacillus sp. 179-BFC.A HS]
MAQLLIDLDGYLSVIAAFPESGRINAASGFSLGEAALLQMERVAFVWSDFASFEAGCSRF